MAGESVDVGEASGGLRALSTNVYCRQAFQKSVRGAAMQAAAAAAAAAARLGDSAFGVTCHHFVAARAKEAPTSVN